MTERKHKRASEDVVEIDAEETGFILEPAQVEVGSGYAIAVSYDENENPVVDIKTYGQVNLAQVRREIERTFPNAQIRQLNQARSVTVVKTGKAKRGRKKK
jgi:hypothetical protein